MSQNIRTKIEFQSWDSLTESTKSLASFFLAHSCLFFRGEYDGDTLSFMSASLLMDNLVSFDVSAISYGTTPSYAILGALYGLNRNSSYEESGVVLSLDGVPEVSTSFVNTQSTIESFRLWGSYSTDYNPAFEYESDFRKDTDYSNYSDFDLNKELNIRESTSAIVIKVPGRTTMDRNSTIRVNFDKNKIHLFRNDNDKEDSILGETIGQ